MEFEHLLAIGIFSVTATTYLVFLALGRRWRRDFEARGVSYWEAPKAERLKTLMATVWNPRLIAAVYSLAYFTNGYMKIAFSMWAPLFLMTERGVDTLQAALFLGLVYARGSGRCSSAWRRTPYRSGSGGSGSGATRGSWPRGC